MIWSVRSSEDCQGLQVVIQFVVILLKAMHAISSVARGGGGGGLQPPHWHVDQNAEWEKHYVFSTFETVLCTGVD